MVNPSVQFAGRICKRLVKSIHTVFCVPTEGKISFKLFPFAEKTVLEIQVKVIPEVVFILAGKPVACTRQFRIVNICLINILVPAISPNTEIALSSQGCPVVKIVVSTKTYTVVKAQTPAL